MLNFDKLYNKLIEESGYYRDRDRPGSWYAKDAIEKHRRGQELSADEEALVDRLWRHGGDDDPDEFYGRSEPSYPSRSLGDEFTDKKGIRRIMIQGSSGDLIPAEKRFVSKKDGRSWERYFDGQKIKVKPAK